MILLPQTAGKIYGVVGLGKSGRATIASLLASGVHVLAWDDNDKARASIAAEFPAARIVPVTKWDFSTIASLVMSPGILLTHEAVVAAREHNVEVIGDIELLWRAQPDARYIAITGTNGKSTTTSLIGHILAACGKRVEVGGNLGIPALALAPLGSDGIYVLELSSYQLDLITTTRFQTAILLNITPDHLDHHGGMAEYIAAKCHIFDRQQKDDVAITGIDDASSESICRTLIAAHRQQVIPVSVTQRVKHGVDVQDAHLHATFTGEARADLASMRALQGQHNWQNAAAAYAACIVNGCAHDTVMAAMATYPGLAHRMQWLGEIGGVQFVNDSKATNADAAEKALKTYDDIYWILGGVAKEGGIETLAPYFSKIRHAYLIGEASDIFAATLEGHVAYTKCDTLEKAFAAAAKDAAQAAIAAAHIPKRTNATNDTIVPQSTGSATGAANKTPQAQPARSVLLAPACASFDQFANFEVRGQAFMMLVEQWKQSGGTHAATA